MPWLKLLHIAALVVWCGLLLYLLAAVAAGKSLPTRHDDESSPPRMARLVFTHVATPAALLAIASGTAVSLVQFVIEPWLIVKLTAVSLLVLCHALAGVLILRVENKPDKPVAVRSAAVAATAASSMAAILWLVLAKPGT